MANQHHLEAMKKLEMTQKIVTDHLEENRRTGARWSRSREIIEDDSVVIIAAKMMTKWVWSMVINDEVGGG